jgi:hypothetical protein
MGTERTEKLVVPTTWVVLAQEVKRQVLVCDAAVNGDSGDREHDAFMGLLSLAEALANRVLEGTR